MSKLAWSAASFFAAAAAALVAAPDTAAADPRVTSSLPPWVAPGGRVVVEGWAGSGEPVTLVARRRVIGRTQSGPLGRFRLVARAPRAGRYRLTLAGRSAAVRLGRLRVRPLVVAAVGDVTFGNGVARAIAAYGPRYPWLDVAPLLRRADIATANLEGAVSTRGRPVGKEYHFRGPPSALAAAARVAGLDVVSIANNHTVDFGRAAFLDTIRYARRFGVATAGGGADLEAARRPTILERGGLRIAFLAYSDVRPSGFDAGPARAGAAPAFPSLVASDVAAARARADVTVVWFHWGVERRFAPTARQRSLARVALRAGATVVLGAHPHVLQPISRSGRRLVAWSLGNFVFAANSPGTERTGILRIRLGARGVVGHSFRRARIAGVQPRLVP